MSANTKNETNVSGGPGIFGMLGVLFVGLKLTGYIDWSWWLVLLPFYWWIPLFLLIAVPAIFIGLKMK